MAVSARRTFAKVKSSAMTPRQPEVPNLTGEGTLHPARVLMARYFSLSRHAEKVVNMGGRGAKRNDSRKREKRTDGSRDLPVAGPCAEDCARRGRKAPGSVRQRCSEPRGILVHLEGQARIRPRAPAAHQDHRRTLVAIGTGSEAPAHLRGPRIHRPPHYRGLARISGLAGRNDSRALERKLERATVERKGESKGAY